ncbi:hypothetical protein PISMIDRAFT_36425, partial [Pisolithus microcarpus 441]
MGVEPVASRADSATTCAKNIEQVLESTRRALEKAANQMRVQAESTRSEAPAYKAGDEVVSVKPNAVELRLPKTLRIHPVVNVSQVKPYRGPLEGQKVTHPGPVVGVEDWDEEFEVNY